MQITKPHRATLRTVRTHVENREAFDCNGTLTGYVDSMPGHGRLPQKFVAAFDLACEAYDMFAVYSYATPIAWFANGEWFVPNTRYSVTTSRHLSSLGLPTRWFDANNKRITCDFVPLAW